MDFNFEFTKKIIDNQLKQTNIYLKNDIYRRKIYLWTNEYVDGYLTYMDVKESDNALTVLGSGDQLFSLISRGVKNVDTFDINYLSEYYALGIKKTQIEKYSYEEFLNVWDKIRSNDTSLDELTTIISDILPFMDKNYREFWRKMMDYNYRLQKNNVYHQNIFSLLSHGSDYIEKADSYTLSKETYNTLKENMKNANINFKNTNIINIKGHYNKNKYDIIILSNILDYIYLNWGKDWKDEQLNKFVDMLFSMSNESARIMLLYSFYCYRNVYIYNTPIYMSKISIEPFEKNDNVYRFNNDSFIHDRAIILKK